MKLDPNLSLFLASLIIGLGFALGYGLMSWALGKVLGMIDRPPPQP